MGHGERQNEEPLGPGEPALAHRLLGGLDPELDRVAVGGAARVAVGRKGADQIDLGRGLLDLALLGERLGLGMDVGSLLGAAGSGNSRAWRASGAPPARPAPRQRMYRSVS
jgi:hypothetical protein